MLERPPDVSDEEVLDAVRRHWEPAADAGGRAPHHDAEMVRLLDLEWRLSEIRSFATWLQGPHDGDADELTRPHFDEHPPS